MQLGLIVMVMLIRKKNKECSHEEKGHYIDYIDYYIINQLIKSLFYVVNV